MNISVQKLLAKIEEELRQAQHSQKEESLREKVYSIKILCELILDEKETQSEPKRNLSSQMQQPVVAPQVMQAIAANQQVFQQPSSLHQPKKLDMDNEANGDSLFDF